MNEKPTYPFYFAVPRGAPKALRDRVPMHLAAKFGAVGSIEHVRSEGWFHLYRIVEVTA